MFHAWWPLEGKGETSFSPTSPFHLKRFYLNIFSIDFRVLLYHGYKPLLCIFHSFSLIYKLHSRISMYQVFHTFIIKLILIKDWNSWHCAWPQLTGLKLHKWTKNHLGIIPRCNINPTFSWWKFWNMTCAPLFWNWTLLNLVLSKKLWTLIPWWFCYKLTPFLMMKLKLYTIFFMKLKTLQFLHGFQFPMLDIIVGYVVHFIDCLLIARHII
jgi:hypothetical protein